MINPKVRNHHYKRMLPLDYALWFATHNNVDIDIEIEYSRNGRKSIEEQVLAQKEVLEIEEPSEESTEEVFKATSESVSESIESLSEITEEEEVATVEDIPNSENFPESLSYDSMTAKELKEECKSRGLPVYGTKATLALRLKRNDEGISESTTETEAPANAAAEEESDIPADEAAVTNGETNENSGK
jgi:hypothetical protein|tara:strand:+ start:160 stop:723 length:564 start_codon:yes stop_codon:yes gene_type:complete